MYIREIFDPLFDFYRMRKGKIKEIIVLIVFPILLGVVTFFAEPFIKEKNVALFVFAEDIVGQLITVLALFISFCMAYLSIILTSNSENVVKLKEVKSRYYSLHNEACTLYQVDANEITYVLLIEIIFLMGVFAEKFLITWVNTFAIKIMLCIDISMIIHILLVMLLVVKDIYFSFWRNI